MKNPKNAGRKQKYGEPTTHIRVPRSKVIKIKEFLKTLQYDTKNDCKQ